MSVQPLNCPTTRLFLVLLLAVGAGCGDTAAGSDDGASSSSATVATTAASSGAGGAAAATTGAGGQQTGSGGASSGSGGSGLTLDCAILNAPAPNPCPPLSGAHGQATFCYRPQWPGVTSVDVYGGFGKATDWTAPFVSLQNDGSGTFTATTSLADGSYPFLFKAQGGADALIPKGGQFALDQENPSFVNCPPGGPTSTGRACSVVTVPQVATPLYHLRGTVTYDGQPQRCFAVRLDAGNDTPSKREHFRANITEAAADGTFDFVVAPGPFAVVVVFPFGVTNPDGSYPDPASVQAAGYAGSGEITVGADTTLDAAEVSYHDYAAMAPTGGTATLPVTFTYTLVPGSSGASAAVVSTSIAGNDPAFASPVSTATSYTWDGTFGGTAMSKAVPGTTYYWGVWQRRSSGGSNGTSWREESLLFPIVFQ